MVSINMTHPRLTIELVPSTSWCKNLRSELSVDQWNYIKRAAYKMSGLDVVCDSVGPSHPVKVHEIWEYEDDNFIQRLSGVLALCPACHCVKHRGLSEVNGIGDKCDRHLAAVNGWSELQVKLYVQRVFRVWRSRSQYHWSLDLSVVKPLLI